jgi:bifunctional non-homologous end joining protein LigD
LLFERIIIDKPSLEGVKLPVQVTWLKPEIVCEVGYHSVTRDGMLRMARYRGLRDKSPKDCSIEQILTKGLEEYRLKRDFTKTGEPMGSEQSHSGNMFVIQEHHSRQLHWDFRLEREGVLKSWAVPKGVPEESGIRRLAIQVEDHPIEYGGFEGSIPEGEYGAGTVKIWDQGVYEALKWENEKIEIILQGDRLSGKYVLIRLKRGKENEWLLLKAVG